MADVESPTDDSEPNRSFSDRTKVARVDLCSSVSWFLCASVSRLGRMGSVAAACVTCSRSAGVTKLLKCVCPSVELEAAAAPDAKEPACEKEVNTKR